MTATGCYIAGGSGTSALLDYQRTNAANEPVGAPNDIVSIPAGSAQNYVFALNPSVPFDTNYALRFDCANSFRSGVIDGVNTFFMASTTQPTADMITIGATPSADGILNVPLGGSAAMGLASVNIGVSKTLRAVIIDNVQDGESFTLPLNVGLCRTDTNGQCISPLGRTSNIGTVNSNQTITLSLFATSTGTAIPLDPATKRLFVVLFDAANTTPEGLVVGATSVAVRTQP